MGIKGLTPLIKQHSESIQTTKLYQLSGKRVAVDASLFIYQSLMNFRNNGDYLRNKDGKITSHIVGIFYKTSNYLSLDITPIYIFDGKPPEEKNNVIKERKEKAKTATKLMKHSTSSEEKIKLEKQSVRLTAEYIDDIKQLLDLMGVSYIHMDGEAEAIASELCRTGFVDYVVTEDMDALTFGCPRLIRSCIDRSAKMKDSISIFVLDDILRDFKLTYNEFVELCIMCGCDYCNNIPRIGNITAFKIISKYKTIKNYLDINPNNIPENYEQLYTRSIELFTMYRDKLNPDDLNIHNSTLDISKLMKYLVNDCNISEQRVQNIIKKMQTKYTKN